MDLPLLDEIDLEILMHRDAHFGSNFEIMIPYYENDGIGIMPDFSIERIYALKNIQDALEEDLSAKILPIPAIEEVSKAKFLYKKLREAYTNPDNDISILITDLILSEEIEPEKEMKAIIKKGDAMVDPLIHIIDSSHFYNPLFPGYGRVPMFAAACLAQIKNPKAIYHLFQALGEENFYVDEALISALVSFGAPAQEFLIKRVTEKPYTNDNEHAAIVLSAFPPDEKIAKVALSLLEKEDVLKKESLASYLICCSEGLKTHHERQSFFALSKISSLSPLLKNEILAVSKSWI